MIEEYKGPICAPDIEAVAELLDGNGELAAALVVPEKDTQALIDLAKYQHQVISEIAAMLDENRGFAQLMRETIRTKCCFGLRAAAKSGAAVMSVGSYGPFEAGDSEAAESAFDSLCIENEALQVENRLLKREVRTLLDTIRCAGEVLENLVKEKK